MVDGGQWRWSIQWRPVELLVETDVKHIVQPGARREGQMNSDIVDELDDAVRTEVARLELFGDGLGNGRGRPLTETKEGLKGSRCPRGGLNWAFLKINCKN
jgi:hypothetical protein